MQTRNLLAAGLILVCLAVAGVTRSMLAGSALATNPSPAPVPLVSTPAVYVPDMAHAGGPLPDGILAWDATMKSLTVTNGQDYARFTFNLTNLTSGRVTFFGATASCSCTKAELPSTPWTLPPGGDGQIKVSVDLSGKVGMLWKGIVVATDKGSKSLVVRVEILPAPVLPMTAADLANGIAAAKVDRQAVFHGDCARCHDQNLNGQFGPRLFAAACAICHETEHRASMVPDLYHLTGATNLEFWRTWITGGKPGSLMPAFAKSQGGPLTDVQIYTLAEYLSRVHPAPTLAPASH